MFAARGDRPAVIEVLLERGARQRMRSADGKTARRFAEELGSQAALSALNQGAASRSGLFDLF